MKYFFLLLLLLACAKKINIVKMDELSVKVAEKTLRNGLKVVVLEKDDSDVVSVQLWVKAGSSLEAPKMFGAAHLLEHMAFKGSELRDMEEIAKAIESEGGYINAWTGFDETVYWTVMPKEKLELALEVLRDMVFYPKIEQDDFELEKKVVLEEIRRGDDLPEVRLNKRFFKLMFEGGPYGHPIIGYKDTVKNFTPELIMDFHLKHYLPSSSVLIIAGDLKQVPMKVEKVFGKIEGIDTTKKVIPKPKLKGPKVFIQRGKEFEAHLIFGFAGFPFDATKTAHLDIAASCLDTRLEARLKLELGIVNSISANYWSPKGPGVLEFSADFDGLNLKNVVKEITREVFKAKLFGFSEEEIKRASASLLANIYTSSQKVEGLAKLFGWSYLVGEGVKTLSAYIDVLKDPNPKLVWRIFSDVVQTETLLAGIYLNERTEGDPGDIEDLIKGITKEMTGAYRIEPVKGALGAVKYTLTNGVRVILKRREGTGTVSLVATVPGGLIYDGDKPGLSNLVARSLTRGTKGRTAERILIDMEEIGGSISGFSSRDFMGIKAEFLSEHLERGLDIFFDVLLYPTFPEIELEKVKEEMITILRARFDNPANQAFEEFTKGLFGEHPYALPLEGDEVNVRNFTKENAEKYWNRALIPQQTTIAVAGEIDVERALSIIRRYTEEMLPKVRRKPTAPPPKCPESSREITIKRELEQYHIVVGFCGVDIFSDNRYALSLLSAALSGQGGRLFLKLRDKKGLAYVVTPVSSIGVQGGYIGAYIASAKGKDALKWLMSELKNVADAGITKRELARAKNMLIGSIKRGLQTNSDWAYMLATNEFLGLGFDFISRYQKKILRLTSNDVREIANRYLNLRRSVTLVLGH